MALAFMLGAGFFIGQKAYATEVASGELTGGCPWKIEENGNIYDLYIGEEGSASTINRLDDWEWPWSLSSDWGSHYDLVAEYSILPIYNVYIKGTVNINGSMARMFSDMSIKEIDLSNLNTVNVDSMAYLFFNCPSLNKITFGDNFKTSNVTSMRGMFYTDDKNYDTGKDGELIELDLSTFDTSKVTNMADMFRGQNNLTDITFGENFDTSNVTDMSEMFFNCGLNMELDLSGFDSSKLETTDAMFKRCGAKKIIFGENFTPPVGNCHQMFYDCKYLESIDLSHFDFSDDIEDMSGMFGECTNLKSISFGEKLPRSIKDISTIFRGCESLESIDLSDFDFSDTENMRGMFIKCKNLKNITFGDKLPTGLKDASQLFRECESLEEIDLSDFDFSEIENAYSMFLGCKKLKDIDFGQVNGTPNLKSMGGMFALCESLQNVDLTGFTASGVVSDGYSIQIGEYANAIRFSGEGFGGMFYGCSALESVVFGEGFNASNAYCMSDMFNGCESLEEIDLSEFESKTGASYPTYLQNTFKGCTSLLNIIIPGLDNIRPNSSTTYITTETLEGCNLGLGGNLLTKSKKVYQDNKDISPERAAELRELVTAVSEESDSTSSNVSYVRNLLVMKSLADRMKSDKVLVEYAAEVKASIDDVECTDETKVAVTSLLNEIEEMLKLPETRLSAIDKAKADLETKYQAAIDEADDMATNATAASNAVVEAENAITDANTAKEAAEAAMIEAAQKKAAAEAASATPGDAAVEANAAWVEAAKRAKDLAEAAKQAADTAKEKADAAAEAVDKIGVSDELKDKAAPFVESATALQTAAEGMVATATADLENAQAAYQKAVDEKNAAEGGQQSGDTNKPVDYSKIADIKELEKYIPTEVNAATPAPAAAVDALIAKTAGEGDVKGSTYAPLQLQSKKQSKSSVTLKWSKVKGATQYVIYGNKCAKGSKYQKLATVSGSKKSYVVKKILKAKIKKGTDYKFIVYAVKGDQAIAVSKSIHVTTSGHKKKVNHTKVTVSKKVTTQAKKLKKSKSLNLKAKAEYKKGKKVVGHVKPVRYESSNKKIATVNAKGKVKGVKKGTCYIYAYAQNGVCKKIKITVK